MTVIGDAMKKAGLEAPEPVESGEKHKLAFTQKVACMKSSIQNIVRLTEKYEKVLGDEQEEMDTLSALRSHFIDMTEAFKDMIDDIRVAKQKMDKSENAESLRFYIRYYMDFICPEDMPGDVEEALAKCGSFREIEYYLKCLGYRFQRDFHYAHPSVIIDGWQRPIRIDSLGPQFSREAIRERCLENQRKPELYGYAYPQRKRAPLLAIEYHLRQAQRQDTVTLLFEIFIELLKICTGSNIENTDRRPLSPAMRAEVRKLDQYLEEYKLLCDHRIESPKELLSFQEGLTARISALEEQRYALRLKLRRVKSPEEEAGLKEHCKKITKVLTPLRRERKTVLRIAEHIPKIQELLDAERKTEMEHNNLTRKKERKIER